MKTLRPHTLAIRTTSRGHRDSEGFYHKGQERWVGAIPCHARPAGRANEITYADGTTVRYSYSVYLDSGSPALVLGDWVRLSLTDGTQAEYRVLGVFRYQTHTKVWL